MAPSNMPDGFTHPLLRAPTQPPVITLDQTCYGVLTLLIRGSYLPAALGRRSL